MDGADKNGRVQVEPRPSNEGSHRVELLRYFTPFGDPCVSKNGIIAPFSSLAPIEFFGLPTVVASEI